MNKKAFSLVELSIVVAVIALLVTAISTTSKLTRQAKVRNIASEVSKIRSAVSGFIVAYDAYPGDFKYATSNWSGTGDGDGNQEVEFEADTAGSGSSETGRSFQHLRLAEFIDGNETAGNVLASTPALGYSSEIDMHAVYIITDYNVISYSTPVNHNVMAGNSQNIIRLGKYTTNVSQTDTHVGYGVLTVTEAISIDTKLDDGKARSGTISGHNEYVTDGGTDYTVKPGCLKFPTSADTSASTGISYYNIGTAFLCNISFDILDSP